MANQTAKQAIVTNRHDRFIDKNVQTVARDQNVKKIIRNTTMKRRRLKLICCSSSQKHSKRCHTHIILKRMSPPCCYIDSFVYSIDRTWESRTIYDRHHTIHDSFGVNVYSVACGRVECVAGLFQCGVNVVVSATVQYSHWKSALKQTAHKTHSGNEKGKLTTQSLYVYRTCMGKGMFQTEPYCVCYEQNRHFSDTVQLGGRIICTRQTAFNNFARDKRKIKTTFECVVEWMDVIERDSM